MWFRFAVPSKDSRPDLCGIVGKDGNVYWMLSSIGRFLGYKSPHTFSKDFRRKMMYGGKMKMVQDVLPPDVYPAYPKVNLVTFSNMLYLVSSKRYSFDEKVLIDAWTSGWILLPDKMFVSHSCHNAVRLVVVSREEDKKQQGKIVPIREYVSEYVNFILGYYSKQATLENIFRTPNLIHVRNEEKISENVEPKVMFIGYDAIGTVPDEIYLTCNCVAYRYVAHKNPEMLSHEEVSEPHE